MVPKTSMTLIPCLDQWAILRTCLQPSTTEVSCSSEQNNSFKTFIQTIQAHLTALGCDLRFQLTYLVIPPWGCWAEADGDTGGKSASAPQQHEPCHCHFTPMGIGVVLGAGLKVQGATTAPSGCSVLCKARSPLRMLMGVGADVLSVLPGGYGVGIHRLSWGVIGFDWILWLMAAFWSRQENNYRLGREHTLPSCDCILGWCLYALDQMVCSKRCFLLQL